MGPKAVSSGKHKRYIEGPGGNNNNQNGSFGTNQPKMVFFHYFYGYFGNKISEI